MLFLERLFELLIPFLMLGGFFWLLFTKRGKGWILGGEILHTISKQIITPYRIQTRKITIHKLLSFKSPPEKLVGIEITHPTLMGFSFFPISLTTTEARELITLLEEALNKDEGKIVK